MKMFIDDERHPPLSWTGSYVVIRTAEEAIEFMLIHECPIFISFDHDLGSGMSGYELAKFIIDVDLDQAGQFIPEGFRFEVHSMNPIGAANIRNLLSSYLAQKV